MHTKPTIVGEDLALYHHHLQSDHDFRVWVDVLTLEEKPVSQVDLLDGQMNFSRATEGPERTASMTLSDLDGTLGFGTGFARDGEGVLWVNRLVRVQHAVTVPTLGEIIATPFIGVPTAVSRKGGELSLEAGDKSLLADHGVRGRTYKKGANVRNVLVSIMKDLCGEYHLRIPTTKKTLSRSYSVGMGEDALTPWLLFKRIAGKEMGWRAYFSSDGYATCEPTNSADETVLVEHLLALPDSSTSFTDFINYTKVTSHRKPTNKVAKNTNIVGYTYEGIATLPSSNELSEAGLARNGVGRLLPLVVEDDDLRTQREVNERAVSELKAGSGLDYEQTYETMPFFHLDTGDTLTLPLSIGKVAYDEVSVPFGTGGNMTIGARKWVSAPVKVKRVRSKTTVHRKKKKGGKKNG